MQSAPDLGLVFECAQANRGWPGMDPPHDFLDHADQQFRRALHDPAVEYHHLGIQHADYVSHGDPKNQESIFDEGLRLRVALAQRFEDVARIAALCQRSTRRSVSASCNLAPFRRKRDSRNMSIKVSRVREVVVPSCPIEVHAVQLARKAAASPADSAIHKHAGADAGTKCDEYKIVDTPCDAAPVFTDRRHVRVVIEENWNRKSVLERASHVDFAPAGHVVYFDDFARLWIHTTRDTDGNAQQTSVSTARLLYQIVDAFA